MKHINVNHLKEVEESYFQHMGQALQISARLGLATLFQFMHSLFPFVVPPFGTDAKSLIKFLNSRLPEVRSNEKES